MLAGLVCGQVTSILHTFFSQRLINMNDYDKKLYENVEDLMI